MSSPDVTDAEMAAVVQVLQTPFLSIGPQIAAFTLGHFPLHDDPL
jgi:hypothetical protein